MTRCSQRFGTGGYAFEMPMPSLMLMDRMTLVIAAYSEIDGIVIAADGLVTRIDPVTQQETASRTCAVKTARLNRHLCVGLSGDVFAGNAIFAQLVGMVGRLGWCGIGEGCARWEREGQAVGMSFSEARDVIDCAVQSKLERIDRCIGAEERDEKREDCAPGVLLAGYENGRPRRCRWGGPTWLCMECEPGTAAIIGEACAADPAIVEILGREASSVLDRLVGAIRCGARIAPARVGRNVSLRRFSNDFALEWIYAPEPG